MNLLDSIDKSTYTLLFPENTEMSHYPASKAKDSKSGGGGGGGGGGELALSRQQSYTANPSNGAIKSITATPHPPPTLSQHTILNMKTTLVNGSYSSSSNCDKCESSSDLEYEEKKPLGNYVVSQNGFPNTELETTIVGAPNYHPSVNISKQYYNNSNSYNLVEYPDEGRSHNNSTGSYNIECNDQQISYDATIPKVDPLPTTATLVKPNGVGNTSTNYKDGSSGVISNWGPGAADTYINSDNLISGSSSYTVNAYSGGQKILPPNYFVSDYADIFGNIANFDKTEDVAKLPITSEENNKMYLIGLSSPNNENNDGDEDDDDDDDDDDGGGRGRDTYLDEETIDNEDNSPFQSAAEEMTADGEHDQDPLLFRAPAKQNVFHQFIRSASKYSTKTTRITMQGRRNSFQKGLHHHTTSSSRDGSSSSSALIKEIDPRRESHHHHDNVDVDDDGRDLTSIISGSSSDDMRGGNSSHCSIGILLAVISCFFFATSALIVKISNLHPMELLAVRGTIQAILVSPIVITSGNSFLGPRGCRSLLLARAVLGSVALVMGFASLHLLPLADAATVIFTSPVFVSIFACVCLAEVCSWFDVSMIALTLVGVLLVSKPSFSFISTGTWTGIVGTVCGLIAAMLTALAFIVLRQLKHVHYSVTVFWFSTVLFCFGAVLTVALDGFTLPRTWPNVMECIGIGFCGFMGQILLTKALQSENALPIAVTRTFDIVLAFFYQITLLHDTPDMYSYLGSVLVVSCVLLTAFHRWYKESTKKKYTRVMKIPDDDDQQIEDQHGTTPSSSSSLSRNQHHRRHHHISHGDGDDDEEHLSS